MFLNAAQEVSIFRREPINILDLCFLNSKVSVFPSNNSLKVSRRRRRDESELLVCNDSRSQGSDTVLDLSEQLLNYFRSF